MAKKKEQDKQGARQQQSAYARILEAAQINAAKKADAPMSAQQRMRELAGGAASGTRQGSTAPAGKPQSAYERMRELAGRSGNTGRSDPGIAPYGEERDASAARKSVPYGSAEARMRELAQQETPEPVTAQPELNQYQRALRAYERQARDYGRQQEQAAKEDPAYDLALRFSETELLDKIAQAQGAAQSAKRNYEHRRQTEQIGLYNNSPENAAGARERLNASHRASTERDREAEQLRVALQIRRDMDAQEKRGEYEREILGSPGYSDELARKGLEFIAEQIQKERKTFEGKYDVPDRRLYQDYMTEDERRVFGYLTAMDMHYAEFPASGVHYEAWRPGSQSWYNGMYAGGRSAAYIRSLHDELIERMNDKAARERFVPQEGDSILKKAGKVLDYAASGLNEGIGIGVEGLANAFNPNYQGYHTQQQELRGYAQAAVAKDHPGSFLARLYRDLGSATQSIGQMLPAMVLGYGAGAVIGMLGTGVAGTGALSATNVGATAAAASTAAQRAAFFLSIKGNAYAEGREQGLNENQAQIYSTINALSETSLQSLIGGIAGFGGISEQALGLRVNQIRNVFGRVTAHLALNASGELLEENLQDWIDPIVLSMLTGKEQDFPTLSDMLDTSLSTLMMLGGMNAAETVSYANQSRVHSNLLKIAKDARKLSANDAAYLGLAERLEQYVQQVDENPDTIKFTRGDVAAALNWKNWMDLSGQEQSIAQGGTGNPSPTGAEGERIATTGEAGLAMTEQERSAGIGRDAEGGVPYGVEQNTEGGASEAERNAAAAQNSVPYAEEQSREQRDGGPVPYEENPQFAEIEKLMHDAAASEAQNYGAERIVREIRDAEAELAQTVSGSDTEAILRGRIRGLTDALQERNRAETGSPSSAADAAPSPEGEGFDNGLGVNPEFRQDAAADNRRYVENGGRQSAVPTKETEIDAAKAEASGDASQRETRDGRPVPYDERSLNNGAEEGFDDRGERDEGMGAGRQAGELEGGAGGSVARGEARKSDAGRKARIAALRADQSARDIGVNGGSDEKTLRLIEDRALYTSAMERIDAEAKAMGAQVSFVKGRLKVKNPETGKYESVAAIRQPGENGTRFFVRADTRIYTEEQLFKHELLHEALANDPTLRSELIQYMRDNYSQEELVRLAEAYIDAYKGIYGNDDEAINRYLEEMLCDAYADMQRGRADNRIGRETVAEFGERIEKAKGRAPPTERTSETGSSFSAEDSENHKQRTYSYAELTAKKPIVGTIVDYSDVKNAFRADGTVDTAWLVNHVLSQCRTVKTNAPTLTHYVKVADIGRNVEVTNKGITHGISRKNKASTQNRLLPRATRDNAIGAINLADTLANSIEVNLLNGRGNLDVPYSHVLIGITAANNEYNIPDFYAVRFVVQERKNQNPILVEANVLSKLYSENAKKMGPVNVQVAHSSVALAHTKPHFFYNIADMLQDVKNIFADTFSKDVYANLGMTRENTKFSNGEVEKMPDGTVKQVGGLQYSMDVDEDEDDESLGVFDPGAVEEYEQLRRLDKASKAKEYKPKSTKIDNGLGVNPEFRQDVAWRDASAARKSVPYGRDNGLGVNPEFRQGGQDRDASAARKSVPYGTDNGLGVNPEFRQDAFDALIDAENEKERRAEQKKKEAAERRKQRAEQARQKKVGNAKKASEQTLKARIREREQELRELDRMKDGGHWNDALETRRASMLETLELEKAELARKAETRRREGAPARQLRQQIEAAEAELRALNTAERSGGLSEEQQQRRQELTEQIKELNSRLHARQETQRRKAAELKDAELQKEPPKQAKKEFREDALNLFSIPKDKRSAMGAVLNQFADRVIEKGSVSHEDRQELIRTLYERGVETVHADEYYRTILQTLKNKRIYVNEQTRAEFGDDWNAFRKNAWGLGIYLTNNANDPGVDVWNMELADAFPGSFDANNLDMKDILEAITQLAEEGRDQKLSLAEMMEHNRKQTGESIDSQMDTLERKVDSLIEKFAEKAKLEVELRGQSVMRRALERRDMREKAERNAKRRSENLERENLMKKLRTLQRMRSKSDAETRAQIDDVLGDIDTVARSISPRGLEDLQELARIYEEAKEDPNFLGSPYVEKRLDRLRQTQIDDLDISTVTELANTVSALITAIRDRNRLLADERHREVSNAAHAMNREILDSGGKPGALAKWTANEHLSPRRFLQRLGGWVRGGEMERVSQALEDGQTKQLDYMRQATRLFDGFVKNEENQAWLRKASGKNAEWISVSLPVVTENGRLTWKDVSITPMMRVSLYMHGQNKDNLRHIEGGGVTIPDMELYRKGRIKEAYAQGVRVKMLPETVFAVTKDMSRQELAFARLLKQYYDGYSKEKINETSMLLEGFERAGVENYYPIRSSQNFLAKDAETVDPTSKSILQLGSIVNERVHSGNPIILQDASDTLLQHIDQMAKYYGLAVPIRDFNALYQYTFHDSGEDGQKEAFTGSLKETLDHTWGSGAQEYIDKLLADLQQSSRQSDTLGRLLSKLRGNLAGASLTLNPAVALSQVASLFGAAPSVGWDGVLAGIGNAADVRQRVDMDLVETYTPLLWYRNQGNSTQELGDYMKEQGLAGKLPWLLGWIQKMDTATIKALWYAAEHRVSRDTDLAPGSEEEIRAGTDPYYQAVAAVFNRAVYDTQPNYTEMQRPQILRSESDLTKMLTMYKTVPLQYYNMMYEAAGRLHADKQRLRKDASAANKASVKKSQKAFVNTFSGILAANIAYVAIKALVKNLTFRDKKYRDEDGEYTAASLGGQLGKELLETYAGSFIGGSELMTAGEKLYDAVTTGKYSQYGGIEVSAVSALEDALGTIYNLGTALNKEDPTKGLDALREGALTISSVFGVPARNAETYLKAILKWISPEAAARYENVFDEKDKRDLSGEHGRYLRAALHTLMDNRTENLDDATIDELVRLWGEGGNGAIPSAVPSSFKVSVDGESTDYKLGYRDRNTYRETWSDTVSDALSELIGTELYRNSTDEEKTKLIHKLYDYAGQTAKSAVSENAAPDRWVNTGWSAVLSGVPLAEYVCYDSQAKALDAKDDAGESVSGLKNHRNLELIRDTGWTDEQQEQIYLASTITSDALREKEHTIRNAGFSWSQTAEVLAVVGSNWDHAKQIIDTKIDTRAKVKALSLYLGENDYKAVKAGQIYRMDLKLWKTGKEKADVNGNGKVSQDEATAYIDRLKINLEEKAYLWQMLCPASKADKNPYSTTMGQSIWEYMQTVVKP